MTSKSSLMHRKYAILSSEVQSLVSLVVLEEVMRSFINFGCSIPKTLVIIISKSEKVVLFALLLVKVLNHGEVMWCTVTKLLFKTVMSNFFLEYILILWLVSLTGCIGTYKCSLCVL